MTDRIEESFAGVPWAEAAQTGVPSLSVKFLTEFLPRFAFPRTTCGVLEAFSGLDVKAEELARILERNPYYEYQFRRTIDSLGKREHTPSVAATVVLLGMQRSRDLILAYQMYRTVTGNHIPWNLEGKPGIAAKELLAFTAKTEEPLTASREPWATTACLGGFLFDWAVQLSKAVNRDHKALLPFIDSIFTHGVLTAKIAVALSPLLPGLTFKRYLFCASVVHDIGKVVLALLDPAYPAFHLDMQKRGLSRGLRLYAERTRFGVTHDVLGAAVCEVSGVFKPVSRAVLFHHEPNLLKREGAALYLFSGLLAYSSNVARHFTKPEKEDADLFASWKGPELRDFPLDPKKAEPVIAQLITSGA